MKEFRGHKIYTVAEAKEKGIEYLDNWREGWAGDWVLTDDGHVAEILRRSGGKLSTTGKPVADRGIIRIPTGSFAVGAKRMDSEPRKYPTRLSDKPQNLKDPERGLTYQERAFVQAFMATFDVVGAFRSSTNVNQDTPRFEHMAFAFSKRANIQMAIQKEVQDRLGLTEDFLTENLMKAIKEGGKDRISALKLGAQMIGAIGGKTETTSVIAGIITEAEMARLEGERDTARLQRPDGGDAGGSKTENVLGSGPVREGDFTEGTEPGDPTVS